jgi:hypothetical protein
LDELVEVFSRGGLLLGRKPRTKGHPKVVSLSTQIDGFRNGAKVGKIDLKGRVIHRRPLPSGALAAATQIKLVISP